MLKKSFFHTYPCIWLTLISLSFSFSMVSAEVAQIPELTCSKYNSQFQECMVANKNGTTRNIKEYVCLQSQSMERVLDQIILDINFQEIDAKLLNYLVDLKKDKEASANEPLERIDEIMKNFWGEGKYYQEYKALCQWWILAERATCTLNTVPLIPAGRRVASDPVSDQCMRLVSEKMSLHTDVAARILGINKSEVLLDRRQAYRQQERDKYSSLLDDMRKVVGYCGSIWEWLTHYTPQPLQ